MENLKNDYQKTLDYITFKVETNLLDILRNYSYTGQTDDTMSIKDVVCITLDSVLNNEFIVNSLTELIKVDSEIVDHSIRVAITSIILGFKNKLNPRFIEYLGMSGFLHDIGKAEIFKRHPNLADRNYKYTVSDRKLMQSHPIIAYNSLKNSDTSVPFPVLRSILMHHVWRKPEFSYNKANKMYLSYPLYFNGKKIDGVSDQDDLTGILRVTDYYEAISTKTNSPKTALANIRKQKDIRFGDHANLLEELISPYGVGDIVSLENSDIATVIEQTSNPKKPIIKINSGDFDGKIINLLNNKNFNIQLQV